MATNYKNILLKDNNGQVLLPITLSYYVEYKDGTSVKSYLDTLSSHIDNVNGYIDGINSEIGNINKKIAQNGEVQQNIINSVNDILTSYVTKPDYAYAVVFDNKTNTSLSDSLKNLNPVEGSSYVSTQQVIEALDARVTSTYSYVTTSINSLTSYANELGGQIDGLDEIVQGLNTTVDTINTSVDKINKTLYNENGELDLTASSIKYTGTPGAGTEGKTNVQAAIDAIGSDLQKIQTDIEGVITQAGVSSITGYNGILIDNESGKPGKGAVTVKVNLDNEKLSLNSYNAITVVESGLRIASSQITDLIPANKIEGGLDANNINITYSYMEGNVEHADGKKSVQTFYNEYETKIKDLEAASKAETLDGKYKVTVTPSDSEGFAKVYTLTQNSETIGTINIPKDQFLDAVYYINSQEDAASKLPEGTALTPEELTELPALVFIWKVTDSKTYSVVSIKSILGTVTNEIDTKVNALDKKVTELGTDVETLKTSVSEIQNSYITGATINGEAVNVVDHVLQLSYNILYVSGTLSEGISEGFLKTNGITLS